MTTRTKPTSAEGASLATLCIAGSLVMSNAHAHGISEESKNTMSEGGILDYIWLGAEHMVTGYDHLLFLFGVIFFLANFRDVVRFITAFTLGHCITLLGATMAGITANAYIIDAVIALSVIYKGFENLDGFKKTLKVEPPNLLTMVFIFGLIHGFGLSTRLQELTLGQDGLVSRILAFNLGVELGQIAALTIMLGFFAAWKKSASFTRFSTAANTALILAGAGLFVMQIDGYMHQGDHHHASHEEADTEHGKEHKHGEEALHRAEAHHHTVETKEATGSTQPSAKVTEEAPSETEAHSHGGETHSHGEKPHSHSKKEEPKEPEPSQDKKHSHGHSHSHGSGKTHSH